MTILTRSFVALAVLLMRLHTPIGLLNLLAPRAGISVTRDLHYGEGPRRTIDVYAPSHLTKPAPVVVFFYGGGWESGVKRWYRFVGAALAARGMVVAIPDYRVYPQVQFPAFIQDAAASVAWMRQNAARFGGDPRQLFLMGHSAGGEIAGLLALDPSYLRAVGLSPRQDVCGVIGLAGADDYQPVPGDDFAQIFGAPANWPRSRPVNFVTPDAPPMLLLAGEDDHSVPPDNTLRLAARLRTDGDSVETHFYDGIDHDAILTALAGPLTFLAPVRHATLRFIAQHAAACGG